MRRLILFLLLLALAAGCGGGGSLAAPSGAVITLTPSSKEGAPIKITSTSNLQKSIVQLYQISVKDSSATGAKGVRDTIFNTTFELSTVPGTSTTDLASLVTLCDGSAIINTTAERQTDNQGIYNLCVVFKVGGGLNYTGNLRVLSGTSNASTTVEVTSTLPELAVSPDLTIPPGSRGQFTITGGSPEYTITSSSLTIQPSPSVVTAAGGTFLVTIPPGTTESPIVFTVRDAAGKTVKATVTVGTPPPPTILPAAATVVAGGTVKFMIIGGVPNYTVTSSIASIFPVPETVTVNGGTFTVAVPANTPATSVTLNVRDSIGGSKDVTLTIQAPTKPVITPSSLSMTAGSTATFAITGGVPGYTVVSNNSLAGATPSFVADSGDTFRVVTSSTAPTTSVTLTAIDAIGQTVSASVSITVLPPQLAITPNAVTVVPSTQQNLNFTISGGTGPYSVVSSNPADVYFGSAGTGTTTGSSSVAATVRAGAAVGTVTIRVTDSTNAQRTATITILALPPLLIVPDAVPAVLSAAPDDTITFTISGGVAPYTVTSSNPAAAYLGPVAGTPVIAVTSAVPSFTATVPAGAVVGAVTITTQDSIGNSKTVTITIQ